MNLSLMWLIAGIVLLIAEMATGTLFLIFVAMGCFIAAAAGMIAQEMITAQIVVCALVSLIGTFGLRKPLSRRLLKSNSIQADVGKEVVMDSEVEPQKKGRVSYQGTTWEVTNIGLEPVRSGDHALIVGIDGNILLIRKLN